MDEKKTMGKSLTLFNSKFSLERDILSMKLRQSIWFFIAIKAGLRILLLRGHPTLTMSFTVIPPFIKHAINPFVKYRVKGTFYNFTFYTFPQIFLIILFSLFLFLCLHTESLDLWHTMFNLHKCHQTVSCK